MSISATIDNLNYTLNTTNSTAIVADNSTNYDFPPDLTIPNTVEYLGSIYTVTGIAGLAFYQVGNRLTNVVLPTNTAFTSIGSYAFNTTNIVQITIPSSVVTISAYCFQDCYYLKTINIDGINSKITNFEDSSIQNCTSLERISIPVHVTDIAQFAFENCNKLSAVFFYTNQIPINEFGYSGGRVFNNIAPIATAYYVKGADLTGLQTTDWFDYYIQFSLFPCFKEDSLILTDKGYRRIQELRKGDLVKTLLNGFLKIDMIGKKEIVHKACVEDRIKNQLYKCSHENFKEVFEPLVITGCHSILVDEFVSEEQKQKAIEINENRLCITDRKYRLPACVDERTTVYEIPGTYTIYHLALENPDYYMNYGIYANGLLVETCSRRYLKELSGMELIE